MSTHCFSHPSPQRRTRRLEQTLRPRRLDDFVGQERVKEQLAIALAAAKARGEALDHVLLVGPPGPRQDEPRVHRPRGARRRHPHGRRARARAQGDIAAILTSVEPRDVLFVDEIHRLSRAAEEILYPALEDFRLDIVDRPGSRRRAR